RGSCRQALTKRLRASSSGDQSSPGCGNTRPPSARSYPGKEEEPTTDDTDATDKSRRDVSHPLPALLTPGRLFFPIRVICVIRGSSSSWPRRSAVLLALQPLANPLAQPADRALGVAEPLADLLGGVTLQAQFQDRALVLAQAAEQLLHRLAQ